MKAEKWLGKCKKIQSATVTEYLELHVYMYICGDPRPRLRPRPRPRLKWSSSASASAPAKSWPRSGTTTQTHHAQVPEPGVSPGTVPHAGRCSAVPG